MHPNQRHTSQVRIKQTRVKSRSRSGKVQGMTGSLMIWERISSPGAYPKRRRKRFLVTKHCSRTAGLTLHRQARRLGKCQNPAVSTGISQNSAKIPIKSCSKCSKRRNASQGIWIMEARTKDPLQKVFRKGNVGQTDTGVFSWKQKVSPFKSDMRSSVIPCIKKMKKDPSKNPF